MLILAIDTSGRQGSVAACRGDAVTFEVLAQSKLEGGTYSARLVPSIAELLLHVGVTKAQIDGIAVVDGPGSFTGLRVGLSSAKGLCEVLAKPLAAVSMLEALAVTYGLEGETVAAVLDAGRGEVYIGQYAVADQSAERQTESIVKVSDFLAELPVLKSRVITTSTVLNEPDRRQVLLVTPIQADTVARIGLRKLLKGESVDPAMLDANYIRRSDAELFSPPKH